MKKEYISSIIKNHKITNKQNFDGVSLKGYVASLFEAMIEASSVCFHYVNE